MSAPDVLVSGLGPQAGGRVLYIEDAADLRLAVRLSLDMAGWDVVVASTAEEGLDAVATCDPDVVLLDLGLPDLSGMVVLARLKDDPATAWRPVVVLSGRSRPDEVAALLRSGAQDYVVKPFEPDELEARLCAARRVAVEHRRRQALEDQLTHLVDHDPLTRLLNRRGFEAVLDRIEAQIARYASSASLVVLDLDHFKEVNDSYGHRAGDALLVAVADLLRRTVRASDVVARLGGDEFAVLLPHSTVPEAEVVADKLVRVVRDDASLRAKGWPPLSVSVGVACFDRPARRADVLADADAAMYRAKQAGRDRWAGPASERDGS